MLFGHGDDAYLYPNITADFSSNISPEAYPEGLEAHLAACLRRIRHYPEPEPTGLERMIAEREGISSGCVLATNGATEAIYLAAQATRGGRSAIAQPTFSEYEAACRANGHTLAEDGETVWICNPNNPTGAVIPKERLLEMARDKRRLFIIDQAYEDYTLEPTLTPREAAAMGNVVLLHSMTKRHAIPGLRLGYITTAEPLVERLREAKQPWSVNAVAVAAGEWLVSHGRKPDAALLTSEAQRLRERLNHIKGISVGETKTNFMLARIDALTAAELKERLARKHGMLIRDASNFPTLTPHHFRVAAQSPEQNDALARAISWELKEMEADKEAEGVGWS